MNLQYGFPALCFSIIAVKWDDGENIQDYSPYHLEPSPCLLLSPEPSPCHQCTNQSSVSSSFFRKDSLQA